jgi:hypothetical protein
MIMLNVDVHDVNDDDELLFWPSTVRYHDDHAPRLGEETPDCLNIVANRGHMLCPRSQKRCNNRA